MNNFEKHFSKDNFKKVVEDGIEEHESDFTKKEAILNELYNKILSSDTDFFREFLSDKNEELALAKEVIGENKKAFIRYIFDHVKDDDVNFFLSEIITITDEHLLSRYGSKSFYLEDPEVLSVVSEYPKKQMSIEMDLLSEISSLDDYNKGDYYDSGFDYESYSMLEILKKNMPEMLAGEKASEIIDLITREKDKIKAWKIKRDENSYERYLGERGDEIIDEDIETLDYKLALINRIYS